MAVYKNINDYDKKIKKWSKEFPEDMHAALKKAAQEVLNEVQDKHLSGPKMPQGVGSKTKGTLQQGSGTLLSSMVWRVYRKSGGFFAYIGNLGKGLKYARIHEYGGTITPKKGKYLKFKIGDRTIFAKSVKIPERSYLRSSLKAKNDKIKDIFLKAMKRSYNNA